LIHGDHMIRIVHRLEVNNQRRKPIRAQRRRCKDRPLQTMRSIFCEHPPRRPSRICKVIRHRIKMFLNSVRILEAAEFAQLLRTEAGVVAVHRYFECSPAVQAERLADKVPISEGQPYRNATAWRTVPTFTCSVRQRGHAEMPRKHYLLKLPSECHPERSQASAERLRRPPLRQPQSFQLSNRNSLCLCVSAVKISTGMPPPTPQANPPPHLVASTPSSAAQIHT